MSRKLANATTRSFRAGEVIFREGDDPRDEAFMIHAGRVEVRKRVGLLATNQLLAAEGQRRQTSS